MRLVDQESLIVLSWFGASVVLVLVVMTWRRFASMWLLAVAVVMSGLLIAYAGLVRGMNVTRLALGAVVLNVTLSLVLRSLRGLEKTRAE